MREAGTGYGRMPGLAIYCRLGRDWSYERGRGLSRGDYQDGPYTEHWGETGDMREARDWARRSASMGPILKTGERLKI